MESEDSELDILYDLPNIPHLVPKRSYKKKRKRLKLASPNDFKCKICNILYDKHYAQCYRFNPHQIEEFKKCVKRCESRKGHVSIRICDPLRFYEQNLLCEDGDRRMGVNKKSITYHMNHCIESWHDSLPTIYKLGAKLTTQALNDSIIGGAYNKDALNAAKIGINLMKTVREVDSMNSRKKNWS